MTAPVPSSSCTGPGAPPLNPAELEPGPTPQPLGAHLGVWPADERGALLDAKPDPTWAEGPISTAGPNRATRAVKMTRLPKALRAWLGRPVKVLGASGVVCESRLQRFSIQAQVTPDLRTAEHWEGCSDAPAIAPSAIAEEVWRVSEKVGRTLVAEFSAPCKGALLAFDPDLPTPVISAPEPATAEVGVEAMAAFRQIPEYAQIQARFRSEQPATPGSWDDREVRRSISTLALPGHTPLFVVSEQVGSGCASASGGFSASLSALWGGGGPAVAVHAIDDRKLTPTAIVDLDGSGGAILFGPDGPWAARSVLRPKAKPQTDKIDVARFERVFLSSVPFFPGPC
ncbi:MAG: hypothetical protein ABIQ16_24135 [Polyangiaceae bacterium]